MAKFTIKAGSSENLELACRYMLIDSITNNLQLRLKGKGENSDFEFDIRGGGEISELDEIVDNWVVHNDNAIDVELVVQYGSVKYRENRIDGGVQFTGKVDTSPVVKALTSKCYAANHINTSGVLIPATQLVNPVGSGKNLIIDTIAIGTNAGSRTMVFGLTDLLLTTDVTNNQATSIANKGGLINDSVAKIFHQNNLGNTVQAFIESGTSNSSLTEFPNFKSFSRTLGGDVAFTGHQTGSFYKPVNAIVVQEGQSMIVSCNTGGAQLSSFFEWEEIDNV